MNVSTYDLLAAIHTDNYLEAIAAAQDIIATLEREQVARDRGPRQQKMKDLAHDLMEVRTGDGALVRVALQRSREFGCEGTFAPSSYETALRRHFDITPPTSDVGFVRVTVEYLNEFPRYTSDSTGSEQGGSPIA